MCALSHLVFGGLSRIVQAVRWGYLLLIRRSYPEPSIAPMPKDPQPRSAAARQAARPVSRVGSVGTKGRAVIVGLAADVPRALEHPAMSSGSGFEVCGVVTVSADDVQVREHADALHHLLTQHRAGTVMVAGPLGPETMRAVSDVSLLHGCRLLAVMPSEVVPGHEPKIVWEGESPLVQLAGHRQSSLHFVAKRALDVAGATVGLVLTAPLMAAMVGLRKAASASQKQPKADKKARVSSNDIAKRSLRSAPAQKALSPEPVTTRHRTLSSAFKAARAA